VVTANSQRSVNRGMSISFDCVTPSVNCKHLWVPSAGRNPSKTVGSSSSEGPARQAGPTDRLD
jgi:hypothetical protein